MNTVFESKEEFIELYESSVMSLSGKPFEDTSDIDRFDALVKLIASKSRAIQTETEERVKETGQKRVHHFSIEFLIGRLLDNYLLNLGIRDLVKDGLAELGCDLDALEEYEPDPALGNGGLGRLAACFLDSMAHEGIAGYGNGMRYRYGLFKQEIVNGAQHETTDEWLSHGYPGGSPPGQGRPHRLRRPCRAV